MKAKLNNQGQLVVQAENPLEEMMLKAWFNESMTTVPSTNNLFPYSAINIGSTSILLKSQAGTEFAQNLQKWEHER